MVVQRVRREVAAEAESESRSRAFRCRDAPFFITSRVAFCPQLHTRHARRRGETRGDFAGVGFTTGNAHWLMGCWDIARHIGMGWRMVCT